MTGTEVRARRAVLACLAVTGGILLTRLLTLTHNLSLHPDEHVFYLASDSLARFLTGRADSFQEIKEYPEGAIVLLTPFHLLGQAYARLTGAAVSPQVLGRIGSTVYFLLGTWLGLGLLGRYFDRSRPAAAIYCLTAVFSLLHLEQSRYGTGESASMLLLLLILRLSADALESGTKRPGLRLAAAAFLTGLLGAVKYPLVFFFAIPCFSLARLRGRGRAKSSQFLLLALLLLAGFLAVSPKLVADPVDYLYHLLAKETHAYVRYGNPCEIGGPVNHLLSLLVYFTLYSGLPAAPVFLWESLKKPEDRTEPTSQQVLFSRFLPLLLGVFFLYNLFAKSLFMRTYYPFFFLTDLYVSAAAGKWFVRGGRRRAAVGAAALLLVLRGGAFTAAMTETSGGGILQALAESAVTDSWEETTILLPGYFLDFDRAGLKNLSELDLTDEDYPGELRPGELVIASTLDHSRANHYMVPPFNAGVREIIRRWDEFSDVNGRYRVGSVYPEYYYWLFGFWIKGTTGTDYEFPTNTVYYRP